MELTPQMQAALESGVVVPRWILTLSAKDRDLGIEESVAFWTGAGVRQIELGEVAWTCYPNVILEMSEPTFASGLDVLTQRFTMWSGTREAMDAVRRYDLSLARAELHLALLDNGGQAIIGTALVFQGFVDSAPINEASGTVELTVVADIQEGTGKAGLRKSDASLRLRSPDDTGAEYADIAGSVPVVWGVKHDGQHVVARPR